MDEIIKEQKDNVTNLENKLKLIISQCNKKTLKRIDEDSIFPSSLNADMGEQHILENGVSVYIFYKDNQPIDYWISNVPLYEEYEFTAYDGSKHNNLRYTGVSGIEYTSGGVGNGLSIDNSSYKGNQIGLIGPKKLNGNLEKIANTVPTMSGGYSLNFGMNSKIAPDIFQVENYSKLQEIQEKCDVEGYISSCIPTEEIGKKQVKELQTCLGKINELYKDKQISYEKRSKLKLLFAKNKSLDEEISKYNAFGGQTK